MSIWLFEIHLYAVRLGKRSDGTIATQDHNIPYMLHWSLSRFHF